MKLLLNKTPSMRPSPVVGATEQHRTPACSRTRFAKVGACALVLCSLTLTFASLLTADQLRYMDSSGNIHFVDSLRSVPREYQTQIITPTPVPVLDRKQLAELKRKQREVEQDNMRKEHDKMRDLRKRQDELDRIRRKEDRELERRDDSRRMTRPNR